MEIKYFIHPGTARIFILPVLRESSKSVWVQGFRIGGEGLARKVAKSGPCGEYHDTWDAAYASLIAAANSKLAIARHGLQVAQSHLGNVKGMKPPAKAEAV
jgi:hypothetical protein